MYKIVVTGLSDFYPSKLFKCFFPESCGRRRWALSKSSKIAVFFAEIVVSG